MALLCLHTYTAVAVRHRALGHTFVRLSYWFWSAPPWTDHGAHSTRLQSAPPMHASFASTARRNDDDVLRWHSNAYRRRWPRLIDQRREYVTIAPMQPADAWPGMPS
ncbi:hypothetical protein FA95DRAFT_1043643 [Auriscalpium vulgare]|uniref:Uncharacterized protein n=1 Tax=Auriscalpium vulgare TaxID=40419 RepID=A0ACB8R581_9AGAM|nr:hypothetical protein FA95DRAFT_1043643 [Auriscalpium vulgare]